MGHPESNLMLARRFALQFGAVVVSPSYRHAPEYKFPIGVQDTYHALAWCGLHASSLSADTSQGFIIGGSSAGANFAGVLARQSVALGMLPALTGRWLDSPVFGHAASAAAIGKLVPAAQKCSDIWVVSWTQNIAQIVLDTQSAEVLLGFLQPDHLSAWFNPLVVGQGGSKLSRMPTALVQVAGLDLTRDDGIVFAYALQDEGVEIRLLVYPGAPHAFQGFMWLLGREVDKKEVSVVAAEV